MSTLAGAWQARAREVAAGARDTGWLAALRWRGVRDPATRWTVAAGAAIVALGLLVAINLGPLTVYIAGQGTDTAAGVFAVSWILSVQRGDVGDVGALMLGGALAVAVFAPLTGTSTMSLAPVEDLHGLRPARLHRYFDAMLINSVSGMGVLQLLALTAVTSVLSLEGSRGAALLVTWATWITAIALTTTIGWSLELALRKWGPAARIRAAAVIVAAVAAAIAIDPDHGRSLFGLGDLYASLVTSAASSTLGFAIGFAAVTAATIAFAAAGLAATRAALARPAVVQRELGTRRPRRMPQLPTAIAIRVLTDSLWRTPEIRRPLIAVIVIGVPGMLVADLSGNTENAVMTAVPIAVALSWAVNTFGVIGPGMTWLSAQPAVLQRIPRAAATIQLMLTILLVEILWLPAYATGRATADTGLRLLAAAIIAGCLGAIISLHLSITRPSRARLTGRGDSLIPPLTALGYLAVLLVTVCAPAAALSGADDPTRLIAVLASLAVFSAGTIAYERAFTRPATRARITAEVSAI